jgi:hypothetical protein
MSSTMDEEVAGVDDDAGGDALLLTSSASSSSSATSSSSSLSVSAITDAAVALVLQINAAHHATAAGNVDGVAAALSAARKLLLGTTTTTDGGGDSGGDGTATTTTTTPDDATALGAELVPEYAPELLNEAFMSHRSATVRLFVAQFAEDVVKRAPQMVGRMVVAFERLVEDADAAVALRAVSGELVVVGCVCCKSSSSQEGLWARARVFFVSCVSVCLCMCRDDGVGKRVCWRAT